MRTILRCLVLTALLTLASLPVFANGALPADLAAKIDKIANDALAKSGVPSASVAVVRDGKLAYAKAYGNARLDPKTPATSAMRYSMAEIDTLLDRSAMNFPDHREFLRAIPPKPKPSSLQVYFW